MNSFPQLALLLPCCLLVGCVSPKSSTPETPGKIAAQRAESKAAAINTFQNLCAKHGKTAEVTDMDDGVGDIKLHFKCVK